MIEVHRKDYIRHELVLDILNSYSVYGNGLIVDVERAAQHQVEAVRTIRENLPKYRDLAHSYDLKPTQSARVKEVLYKHFKVPELLIQKTDKRQIERLLQSSQISSDYSLEEDVREFLKLHTMLNSVYHNNSALESFITASPPCDELSFEGHRVVIAHPVWNILSTKRFSCSKPAFQNIGKNQLDIITYFPWMKLYGADSGQIEPRITYSAFIKDPLIKHLITIYNDAYYGITHYVRMTKAEKIQAYKDVKNVKKLELSDDIKAARSDIKKLMLSANYGGGSIAKTMELGPAFIRDIQQHPLRRQLVEDIAKRVREGQETFYSYFGTPITPESTATYKKGTVGWQSHVERCGLNNPIQSTAADLMNISVYTANKIIREEAKSTWTSIAGYIHDAGYFYVSEKDIDLADKLMECMSYQVYDDDGTPWIPIYCDKHAGLRGV